jgi:hypothetical protein
VILHCNYEELQALKAGGDAFHEEEGVGSSYASAMPESRARVETLLPRLVGDLAVPSLAEARDLQDALDTIVEHLLITLETAVVATHAADEGAVAAYFDYAHALSVSHRLRRLAAEMEALVELLTGEPADEEAALTFRFPD